MTTYIFKTAALLSIVLFSAMSNSENYIYVGDKQYKATNTWNWLTLEVTIGRDASKGLMMLQRSAFSSSQSFKGNVYIFLSDGERITCIDRNIKDHLNLKAISVYYLSESEVAKLKITRISQIRFDINEAQGLTSYSTKNRNIIGEEVRTEEEITKLFK